MQLIEDNVQSRRPQRRSLLLAFLKVLWVSLGVFAGIFYFSGGNFARFGNILSATFSRVVGSPEHVQELGFTDFANKEIVRRVSGSLSEQAADEGFVPSAFKKAESISTRSFQLCDFGPDLPKRQIIFSEIAWMGSTLGSTDEWIEIINPSLEPVDVSGWSVQSVDKKIKIEFPIPTRILPGEIILLSRGGEMGKVGAGKTIFYKGDISNAGEILGIFDNVCQLQDIVDASSGWTRLGGNSKERKTLVRVSLNEWGTSNNPDGTPGGSNEVVQAVSFGADSDYVTTTTSVELPNRNGKSVFITEAMPGSAASAGDEYVEIFNASEENVLLDGCELKRTTSKGTEASLMAEARIKDVQVAPKSFAVFANEEAALINFTITSRWAKSNYLAQKQNGVVLYCDKKELDRLSWTDIPLGQSVKKGAFIGSATSFGLPEFTR